MDKHPFPIFINNHKFDITDPIQTGAALKALAGVPLSDTLFLDRPHEDEVITNDMRVTLKSGDHLHSAPPADYGGGVAVDAAAVGHAGAADVRSQPDGWTFVVLHDFALPSCYRPNVVRLLLKLPPQFPDAAPDMHWVSPPVQINGAAPRGTGSVECLGETWQQFSWHLKPGAWRPGISTLRDFLRAVRSRFEHRD